MKLYIHYLDSPEPLIQKTYDDAIHYCMRAFEMPGQVSMIGYSDINVIYTHLKTIDWERYPNLRFVLCPCTNYDHLKPIPEGIEVIYLNDPEFLYTYIKSTAEWTIYSMLTLLRNNRDELSGSKVGLIGYGRIGQQVASMLKGFDCSVYYFDKKEPKFNTSIFPTKQHDIKSIFSFADIISVHLSVNEETKGIIDKKCFDYIGEQRPYFINSSRSCIVEPNSLISAIWDKKLSGVALDVIEDYTPEQKNTLYDFTREHYANTVITPHIAGRCRPSRAMTDTFVLNKLLYKEGVNDEN